MPNISQSDVISTIEKALELESGSLWEGATAENIKSWDSLGQLSILAALDTLFDGKLADIHEMAEANSLLRILVILKQHSLL